MNIIEIKPVGTFQPLDSEGINHSRTANEWGSLCKTFGFRYDENDEDAAIFHHYDNGTTATVILTQENIPVLRGMDNTSSLPHTLYSKLVEVLEDTGCEKVFVRANQMPLDDE